MSEKAISKNKLSKGKRVALAGSLAVASIVGGAAGLNTLKNSTEKARTEQIEHERDLRTESYQISTGENLIVFDARDSDLTGTKADSMVGLAVDLSTKYGKEKDAKSVVLVRVNDKGSFLLLSTEKVESRDIVDEIPSETEALLAKGVFIAQRSESLNFGEAADISSVMDSLQTDGPDISFEAQGYLDALAVVINNANAGNIPFYTHTPKEDSSERYAVALTAYNQ